MTLIKCENYLPNIYKKSFKKIKASNFITGYILHFYYFFVFLITCSKESFLNFYKFSLKYWNINSLRFSTGKNPITKYWKRLSVYILIHVQHTFSPIHFLMPSYVPYQQITPATFKLSHALTVLNRKIFRTPFLSGLYASLETVIYRLSNVLFEF